MSLQPAILSLPDALHALVQPPEHSLTFFAPGFSREDIVPLKLEAERASKKSSHIVVLDEHLWAAPQAAGIVRSLSDETNTILLSADHIVTDGRYRQVLEVIDEKSKRNVGCFSLLFDKKDTFSAKYFEEPALQDRCRSFVVAQAPTRDAVLCARIMDLIDAQFGDLDGGRRVEFTRGLEDIIRGAYGTAGRVFESGLEFYPVPRDGLSWQQFVERQNLPRYGRDPCGWMLDQYSDYIDVGLLYSGHLQTSDKQLYDSVRLRCFHSTKWKDADAFFRANGILTAADLAKPAPGLESQVTRIINISSALAGRKTVLGRVATQRARLEKAPAKRR